MIKRDFINNILNQAGIPASYNGYYYIGDALELMDTLNANNPKWYMLYKSIADKHNTSSESVDKCIRIAFRKTRENTMITLETIDYYIGMYNTGNADSLAHLFTVVKKEYNDTLENYINSMLKELIKSNTKYSRTESTSYSRLCP